MIARAMEWDLPAMLEIYRPYVENTTVSFEYTPPTPAEFARRFQEHRDFPWLVWREDGRWLGVCWMEKRLLPADTPTDFPRPLPDTEDRL